MTPGSATAARSPRSATPRRHTVLILALVGVLVTATALAGRPAGAQPAHSSPGAGMLAATGGDGAGGATTSPSASASGPGHAGTTTSSSDTGAAGSSAGSGAVAGGRTGTAVLSRVAAGLVDVDTLTDNAQLLGTGMIVRDDGLVLTNHHVIDHATQIRVRDLGDRRVYRATVAAVNPTRDLALLRLQNAANLTVVTFGDSRSVNVGDPVTALGNAGGGNANPVAATGAVTGLNQAVDAAGDDGTTEQLTGMIQANAAAAPGDSGGPMINDAGTIIGVTTAGSNPADAAQGPNTTAQGSNTGTSSATGAADGAPIVDATPINVARAWIAQALSTRATPSTP